MKNNLIFLFSFLALTFSSCKDNERDIEEGDNGIESITTDEESFEEKVEEMRQRNSTVDAIEGNPELSTFAAGLNVWNVEDTLDQVDPPYMVLAPDNAAYSNVYNQQGYDLLEVSPEAVIPYHIVLGDFDMEQLKREIKNANGTLKLPTLEGEEMSFKMKGDSIQVIGATGDRAMITSSFDIENGTAYIINSVLLPEGLDTDVTITGEK